MGPTWVLAAPDGPHVGPMNLAIRVVIVRKSKVNDNQETNKIVGCNAAITSNPGGWSLPV